jgi:GNAT superfamily N-acetyltransferase
MLFRLSCMGGQTRLKKNIIDPMTATIIAATPPAFGRMRPLNVLRDLPAVADLIELCFSATLDSDGRSYIDQMRRNGRDSMFLNWAPRVIETVSLPLSGFIWENNGRVVGNVSLIPFSNHGQKIFLIANVATHPDFRRQGIARQLTLAALNKAREKRARAIWLHVRDDNPGAIHLYEELGFVERARRTTWHLSSGASSPYNPAPDIQILPRPARDWSLQSMWLSRAYPAELGWYQTHNWSVFKPGLLNAFYRLMVDINTMQWSAYRKGVLQGVLGCQRTTGSPDQLWGALPDQPDAQVVTALLLHGRRAFLQSRSLVFEYPAGPLDEAIQAAGFVSQRTLSWMEAPGAATF